MAVKGSIRRVRSLVTPHRDPNLDSMANVIDTMEGRNNPEPCDLPPLDLNQTMQAIIAVTSKEPCYLCEAEPYGVRIFNVPQGLNKLGQKLILYSVCFACHADVTSAGRAEYKLIRQLQAENAMAN